jgi:hypothetical protein
VYANRVDVRYDTPYASQRKSHKRGGGRRRAVQTYSLNSPRRHHCALAAWRDLFGALFNRAVLFICLYLPDGVPHDPATAKKYHAKLFKRIWRKFPWVAEDWRMHLEARKSGPKRGQRVPHFHSLVVNLFLAAQHDTQRPLVERTIYKIFLSDPTFCKQAREYERLYAQLNDEKCGLKWQTKLLDAFRIWLAWAWYDTVDSGDVRHLFAGTTVKSLRTRDQVRSRIHYLARAVPEAVVPPSQTQQEPVEPESPGQAPREQTASPSIGRLWGQRGHLNRTPALLIHLTESQFVRLRRLILAYLRSKGEKARAYARWIANGDRRQWLSGVSPGFTVLGLGDLSDPLWKHVSQSTIFRMVNAVLEANLDQGGM